MICCKIVADYMTVGKNFSKIFDGLSKKGSVLWENRCFYFANTEDKEVTEKTVKKIFKKYGCESYIQKYDKDYQPSEKDSVNWWLEDKLIKIGYREAETDHQEELRGMSITLTELENLFNKSKAKTEEILEPEPEDSGEDK